MKDGQAGTYRLKSETEFHLGLVKISDLCFWFINSEDITRDIARRKALQSREETHGQEQAQTV